MVFLVLFLCVGGCIRKIDIQQGNIMTVQQAQQLHLGMTIMEVKKILGTPMLLNTFNENRIDYVYTFKHGNDVMVKKYITLTFINGHLKTIKEGL